MNSQQLVWASIFGGLVVPVLTCGLESPRHADGSPASSPAAPACVSSSGILRTADGFFPYVEAPQLVRAGERLFLIGSPSFAVDSLGKAVGVSREAKGQLLAGVMLENGRVMLLPAPTTGVMNTPRAAIAPDGALHLIWMSTSRSSGESSVADSVLWSRWSAQGWTQVATVTNAPTVVGWGATKVSSVSYSGGRPFFVATPGLDAPRYSRQIEWMSREWISRPFSGTSHLYPSIISDEDIRVVAFVEHAVPDGNTLFVRRSSDAGQSWDDRVRVSLAGSGGVHQPQILRIGRGRLALVWLSQTSTGSRIRLAVSRDSGRTWSVEPAPEMTGAVGSLQATASNSGIVLVAFQSQNAGRQRPGLARWTGTQWQTEWLPTDSPSIGTISIGMADEETALVLWGSQQGESLTRAPRTRFARIDLTCNTRPKSDDIDLRR